MSNSFASFQPKRGKFLVAQLTTAEETYQEALNITSGSGKIRYITIQNTSDTNIRLKVTIDGYAFAEHSYNTPDSTAFININPALYTPAGLVNQPTNPWTFAFEFSISLRVEIKRTAGTDNVKCQVFYNLD